jgi:hypothetical protein
MFKNKYTTKQRMSWKPPKSIQKKMKVGWNRLQIAWVVSLSLESKYIIMRPLRSMEPQN